MLHATQAILFFPILDTRNNLDGTKVSAKHAVDFVPRNGFSNFGRQPNFVPFVQKLQIRCHPVQRIAEKLELFGTSSFFSHRNLHLLKEPFSFKDVVEESFTLLDNDLSQFVFRVFCDKCDLLCGRRKTYPRANPVFLRFEECVAALEHSSFRRNQDKILAECNFSLTLFP